MNNFISLFLAMLVHLNVVTKDDAAKLNEELQKSTLPDDFETAYLMVKDVFEKVEVEPKTTSK